MQRPDLNGYLMEYDSESELQASSKPFDNTEEIDTMKLKFEDILNQFNAKKKEII